MAKAEDGIAAILNADLKSIGMGVVVDPFHVITCSHVVNEALGHERTRQEHPGDDERIQIIFPYSLKTARTEPATGRVRAWHPVFLGKGLRPEMHDVAVVQLSERVTDDVGIAELSSGDPPPDTRFDVYRHVTGNPSGIPATGETRTKAENGFIALFGASYFGKYIEPGFSGASCWSAGKTVGIVVTSWEDTYARVAHMIPSSTLRKALKGVINLPDHPPDDGLRELLARALRDLVSAQHAVAILAKRLSCYDRMLSEQSTKQDRPRFVIEELMRVKASDAVLAMVRSFLEAAQTDGVGSQSARALENLCYCLLPVLYSPEQLNRLRGTALHDGALFSIPAQYESTAELIMARLEARPVQYKFTDGPDAQPVGERLLPSPPEGGLARDNTTFADDFQRHLSAKLVPTGVRILRPEEEVDAINEVLDTMADLGEYRHYYVYTRSTDFGVNEKRERAARAVQDRFPNIVFFALDAPKDPRLELRIVELLKRILRKRAEGESAS